MQFKHKMPENKEIIEYKNTLKEFAQSVKSSDEYDNIYENFLNIKGFTYRLEDVSQRLFYTFQEAVYAIDLAKLTRDDKALKLNAYVYVLVLHDCIKEFLGEAIDETEKQKAIAFYKSLEEQRAKENRKYHMYQN
jgi:hypothetical protein